MELQSVKFLKYACCPIPNRLTWLIVVLLCFTAALPAQKQAERMSAATPRNQSRSAAIKDKFSRYRQYTMKDGLSNNSVRAIAQDEDHFMWFGTEEGLNRFDGERFTSFFNRYDNKGIPFDDISVLLALPGHRLLIGTLKGLCVLDTRKLEFAPVNLPDHQFASAKEQSVQALHLDRKGQIWVGTNAAVHLLDAKLNVVASFFRPATAAQSLNDAFVLEFLELPNNTVAVKAKEKTLPGKSVWQVIDFQQKTIEPLVNLHPDYGVLDTAYAQNSVASDGQQHLWFTATRASSTPKLFHFDFKTRAARLVMEEKHAKTQPAVARRFNRPFLLPDSLLMVQQYFGSPLIYDLRSGFTMELPRWKTSVPDGKSILSFVDRDGNLWLCPRFEGIYFLTLKTLPSTPMTALNDLHRQTMEQEGVSEEWFGFTGIEHAGRWVVGSGNGGLYSMDRTTAGISGQILSNPFESYAYPFAFTPYRGDTLWMQTLGGLYWYDVVHNTRGIVKHLIPGLETLDPRFIHRDRDGLIWSRVRGNGVCYFDTRTRKFHHFPSQGNQPPFPILSATAITEATDGDLWFSFGEEEKHLVRWRRKTRVFEKVAPLNLTERGCTKAFELLADRNDNLWLFTLEGVFVMNMKTLRVEPIGKTNGMSTNRPNAACLDKQGNLWFATPYGLSRCDPKSKNVRTFYESDGLLSDIVIHVKLMDTTRNILFVSTSRGMCLFEPDKVETAASASPTFITGLLVSNQSVSLPNSGILALSYQKNDLRIEFTGIDFINGPSNRYSYSMELENQPKKWRAAGIDNFANFLNLPPGRYAFRVRSANSDGIWSDEEATLRFVIFPPWWQTWTFRLSALALLLVAAWWGYKQQIRIVEDREKDKAQVHQRLADLEMKALRSQMNPHFVFNALNSIQNFILKNDTREASRYLTKFARLMRLILENSESPMVPLAREIELLRYYTELESLRFNHRFSFDFQVDIKEDTETISIPGMLIQPHIENAIWHGLMHKTGPGRLWIRFYKTSENRIICEIEDDGVGRAQAAIIEKDRPKNHRSTGLANIQHRLELLNAQMTNDIRLDIEDLYDETGQASGTKVIVRMPLVS